MAESQKVMNKYDHIVSHLNDEIDGFNGYADMAEKADEKDDCYLRDRLLEMAYDEYTHAVFIFSYLKEVIDFSITEECSKKYENMIKRHDQLFR